MHRRHRDTAAAIPAKEEVASTTAMQVSSNHDDCDSSISISTGSDEEEQLIAETGEEDDSPSSTERPWTVLSESEVKSLLVVASFAAATSPLSTSTYYPAVTSLARHLGVSNSQINLTISSYQVTFGNSNHITAFSRPLTQLLDDAQIFQGLSPTVTATLADAYGRRPAFLACFAIYFCANVGLALQNDYHALLVLRCLQSAGSSGTFALAQAVTADIATRAERGKYLAYATFGSALGPVVGPVGSLLS
jgi:MFS family permease